MTHAVEWDHIVVGAGSSGAAFAARRVQAGDRVLLLEAGPDIRSADLHPALRSANPVRAILTEGVFDDLIYRDLDSSRSDAQEPRLYWRGRGVGGSSLVNGQIAIRPPLEDFADMVEAGCEGWGPDDVLPYLNRLESDADYGSASYHGADGPIPVFRYPRDQWGACDLALADAAAALGFPSAPDVNAPGATGISPYPVNSVDHLRVTSADGYLEPLRKDANLEIRGDSLVDRVIFDGDRAIGVAVIGPDGVGYEVFARHIVLSAGVIHTPTILIRSGVGPQDTLDRLGVPVISALPVGEGLQDHGTIRIALGLNDESCSGPDDRHTNCTVRYSSDDPDGTFNDLMLVSMNSSVLAMEYADVAPGAGSIAVWLNQAYSRGVVEVTSTDPRVQPEVRERMLSDERDLRRMRVATRQLAELCRRPEVGRRLEVPPEVTNAELYALIDGDDEAALDAFILSHVVDTQHGTSTCRMGRREEGAVVDAECRVFGTSNLRVIDASIFPTVPRANTHLASVMVGEMMADRVAAEVSA